MTKKEEKLKKKIKQAQKGNDAANVREQEEKIKKLEKEKRDIELRLSCEKKAQELGKQTTIKLIGKHYNKFKKEIDDG